MSRATASQPMPGLHWLTNYLIQLPKSKACDFLVFDTTGNQWVNEALMQRTKGGIAESVAKFEQALLLSIIIFAISNMHGHMATQRTTILQACLFAIC